MDTVNILKAEGYKFPTLKESDAMFSADTAPEWADGEVCHRCRVAFSLMVRRHHCRACGQVFCQQCSSKTSTLPKFGIEKEVRVCDACYDKVSRPPTSTAKLEIVDTSNDYGPSQPQKRPAGGKTAEELQEEEELQLALALSQSEAEHKEKERKSRPHIAPDPVPSHPTISPTPSSVSASPEHSNQNSELSRYLDRNYWERRVSRDNAAAPTAPAPASTASHDTTEDYAKPTTTNKAQDDDAQDKEIDEFVETLKSQVEIFVNRMKSNSSRGRSIANDTAVQTLFMNITAMHSRLLKYIQQLDDKRVYLESLQDKVTQIRDSRAALDTLRAEHAARIQQAAEAAERQRQMQMAAKLQAMRKKKHEYLQYQRQLALQRVQEQEREMQLRQEQQKHQYLMSANNFYMPGVSMQQYQPGFPNQPMYGNQFLPQMTTDASMPVQGQGQPQMSQANMPLGVNQMATIAQSLPQLPNNYAMSQSTAAISQTHPTQSMTQQNMRAPLAQQMSLSPMMMQQMHQMRMAGQVGMMMPGGMPNGPPTTLPQQNGQKQNLNQPQMQPNSMMPPNSVGQQNMPQQMMNATNPMMGMQMNMRMPLMQGNQPNQPQIQGYPMQNAQQPSTQAGNVPIQSQMQLPGQPMPLPGQMMQGQQLPGQNQMSHNIPTSQGMPPQPPQIQGQQMSQQPPQNQIPPGQPITLPGQPMPPGQMMMPGQQMPQGQNIPQQMLNQQQQLPNPQQMPNQQQQMPSHPHHMGNQQQMHQNQLPNQGMQIAPGQMPQQMQGAQIPQMQQMQGQPIQSQQGPPMQQGPPFQQGPPMQQGPPQGQPMKMPVNSFSNVPQPMLNQQTQQPQTPVKSEHNNNTAELISFD